MGKIEFEIDKISARLEKIWSKVYYSLCILRNLSENREVSSTATIDSIENKINKLDRKVEKSVEKVLALYQPLAYDFRFVMAALQMNILLERTGNHANMLCNDIKNSNKSSTADYKISEAAADILEEMIANFQNTMEAFKDRNAILCRELIQDGTKLIKKIEGLKSELLSRHSGQTKILEYNIISSNEIFIQNTMLLNANIIYIIESKNVKHKID
jgi:phosphate uptake regulator